MNYKMMKNPTSGLYLLLLTCWNVVTPASSQTDLQLQFVSGQDQLQCRRIFAVVNDVPLEDAGFFCLLLDPLDANNVTFSYATKNDWQMEETSTWFGLSTNDIPFKGNGDLETKDFPYETNNKNDPVEVTGFTLEVSDVDPSFACSAPGASTTWFGIGTAKLVRVDEATGAEEEAEGWVDGLLPSDPNAGVWTVFNTTMECVSAAFDTLPPVAPPTPPPIGGSLADGMMCDSDLDCLSGGCSVTGFCLGSTGSACQAGSECVSGNCVLGLCDTCADNGLSSSNSILTQATVERSNAAAMLSQYLIDRDSETQQSTSPPDNSMLGGADITLFNQNASNPALVAKMDGVCYGIFAPQATHNAYLKPMMSPLTAFQQTCRVNERALRGYVTPQRQWMELSLAQCAATCVASTPPSGMLDNSIVQVALDQNACPIVLAGHGMGGATAVIGSMLLLDLEPQVITFGAPRAVAPDCPLLQTSDRHTRFVNLAFVPSYETYFFDPHSQVSGADGSMAHYGYPVMLDDTDAPLTLPLNDDTTRASIFSPDTTSDVMTPSDPALYTSRLSTMAAKPCFPLPTSAAWSNGHWCDQGDVCLSERCRPFVQIAGNWGAETGSVGVCAERQQGGLACGSNGDCLSESCVAGICEAGIAPSPPPVTPITPTTPPSPPVAGPIFGGPTSPPLAQPTSPPFAPTPPPLASPTSPPAAVGGGIVGPCEACDVDSDCQSGLCITFANIPGGATRVCAETEEGTMSTFCFCEEENNAQCSDGRCEVDSTGTLWLCLEPLEPCMECDEDSDCNSLSCVNGQCADCGGDDEEDDDEEEGGKNNKDKDKNGKEQDAEDENEECPTCETGEDCDSGFCRVVGDGSFCAETADGRMSEGCPCDPRDGSSCAFDQQCDPVDPMLIDVGTCQPRAQMIAVPGRTIP